MKKNFGSKKNFWTPLPEKTGKKRQKLPKNGIFEALKANNMWITSQNHIILLQNGEFCDEIKNLVTENNILIWF